jgi:hypothetical protein
MNESNFHFFNRETQTELQWGSTGVLITPIFSLDIFDIIVNTQQNKFAFSSTLGSSHPPLSSIYISVSESLGLFDTLSNEIVDHILFFLDMKDLCTLSALNRHFGELTAGTSRIWRTCYLESPFFDPSSLPKSEEEENINYKALYKASVECGWTLGTSPLLCGEGIQVSKDGLSCWVKSGYSGYALSQIVKMKRGFCRGRHQFKLRVDGNIYPGTSFGICPHSVPPHGHIPCIQLFAGDGTMNLYSEKNIIQQEGRVRDRIVSGDEVEMVVDFEAEQMHYSVNGQHWSTVENVSPGDKAWHFFIGMKTVPSDAEAKKCILSVIVPSNNNNNNNNKDNKSRKQKKKDKKDKKKK